MIQETHRRPVPASRGATVRTSTVQPTPAARAWTVRRLLGGLLSRRSQIVLIVLTVVAVGLAWLVVPTVHDGTSHALAVLRTGDETRIGDYLRSFGVWGPVISLAMMVAQAIVAPIPGALVVFANGIAFGTFWGTALSVVGQTLAAMVCFWIARVLGRGPVEAMVGRFGLESLDRWVGRWGALGIIVLRLVPGVAFDGVSYGAGLLRIRFQTFVLATVVGVLPQSLFYTWMIQRYPGAVIILTIVAVAIFAGTALVGIIGGLVRRRRGNQPVEPDVPSAPV